MLRKLCTVYIQSCYHNILFIQDLIHGAPINKPVANTASVKAVYFERDEAEITFMRKYVT